MLRAAGRSWRICAGISLPDCLDGRPVMLQVRADEHQRRQVRRVHVRVREFPAEGEDLLDVVSQESGLQFIHEYIHTHE